MNGTRQHRSALVALVLLTSGVAAVTFAISFHGLDGYGYHVMRLGQISPLVPVGVDLASLVALLAAHVRRGDRLGRRAYAWLVFLTTGGLSIAGNLADGPSGAPADAGARPAAVARSPQRKPRVTRPGASACAQSGSTPPSRRIVRTRSRLYPVMRMISTWRMPSFAASTMASASRRRASVRACRAAFTRTLAAASARAIVASESR